MGKTRQELLAAPSSDELAIIGRYKNKIKNRDVMKVKDTITGDLDKAIKVGEVVWNGKKEKKEIILKGLKDMQVHDPSSETADHYVEICTYVRKSLGLPAPLTGKIPQTLRVNVNSIDSIQEIIQAGKTIGQWADNRAPTDGSERRKGDIEENYKQVLELAKGGMKGEELLEARGMGKKHALALTAAWYEERVKKTSVIRHALGSEFSSAPDDEDGRSEGPSAQSQNIDQVVNMVLAAYFLKEKGVSKTMMPVTMRVIASIADSKKEDKTRIYKKYLPDYVPEEGAASDVIYLSPNVITWGRIGKSLQMMFMDTIESLCYMDFNTNIDLLAEIWDRGYQNAEVVSWLVKMMVGKGISCVNKMKGNPLACEVKVSGN
jgi:hypothetical protein